MLPLPCVMRLWFLFSIVVMLPQLDYYYYYDCTGQAATADRALIYNKSLINYGTHN